jgi:hypothetical protein
MQVYAKLVRLCLGSGAVADHKLECGNPLVVLGVECSLDSEGAPWPSPCNVKKWIATIARILLDLRMTGGEASKLAGKLQWATQSTFNRLGRALLRPIIDHIKARSCTVSPQLAMALRWWLEVLSLELRTTRQWFGNGGRHVHLFSDARSTPPRLGAVLFMCASLRNLVAACMYLVSLVRAVMAKSFIVALHRLRVSWPASRPERTVKSWAVRF